MTLEKISPSVTILLDQDNLYTLSDTSKWNKKRNENLNTRLTNALKDSNPMLKVAYTSDEIEQIRKTVKGKGYRITNSLNKNITKEW